MEIDFIYRPNDILCIYFMTDEIPEWHLDFTIRNAEVEKFVEALKRDYTGSVQEMCKKAFTPDIDVDLFEEFCKKNEVEYSKFCGIVV